MATAEEQQHKLTNSFERHAIHGPDGPGALSSSLSISCRSPIGRAPRTPQSMRQAHRFERRCNFGRRQVRAGLRKPRGAFRPSSAERVRRTTDNQLDRSSANPLSRHHRLTDRRLQLRSSASNSSCSQTRVRARPRKSLGARERPHNFRNLSARAAHPRANCKRQLVPRKWPSKAPAQDLPDLREWRKHATSVILHCRTKPSSRRIPRALVCHHPPCGPRGLPSSPSWPEPSCSRCCRSCHTPEQASDLHLHGAGKTCAGNHVPAVA